CTYLAKRIFLAGRDENHTALALRELGPYSSGFHTRGSDQPYDRKNRQYFRLRSDGHRYPGGWNSAQEHFIPARSIDRSRGRHSRLRIGKRAVRQLTRIAMAELQIRQVRA